MSDRKDRMKLIENLAFERMFTVLKEHGSSSEEISSLTQLIIFLVLYRDETKPEKAKMEEPGLKIFRSKWVKK